MAAPVAVPLLAAAAAAPVDEPFRCAECGRTFSSPQPFTAHVMNCRGGERNFKCAYCDVNFYSQTHLDVHVQTLHRRKEQERCQYCQTEFDNKSDLTKHLQKCREKKKADVKAARRTEEVSRLKAAKTKAGSGTETETETAEDTYCYFCAKQYKNAASFYVHNHKFHSGKSLQCPGCNKTFRSHWNAKQHVGKCVKKHQQDEGRRYEPPVDREIEADAEQGSAEVSLQAPESETAASTEEAGDTLRNIIMRATATSGGDQQSVLREVLNKRLDVEVCKKIKSYLLEEEAAAPSPSADLPSVSFPDSSPAGEQCFPAVHSIAGPSSSTYQINQLPQPSQQPMVVETVRAETTISPAPSLSSTSYGAIGLGSGQPRLCRQCKKIDCDDGYGVQPEDLCECHWQFVCKQCNTVYAQVAELRSHVAQTHCPVLCLCGTPLSADKGSVEYHRQYICIADIIPKTQPVVMTSAGTFLNG